MPTITIPHNFRPRHYQLPVLKAMDSGVVRAVAVWHRRSGKEKTFINLAAKKAAERVGAYYYIFPTYSQAKKAVWDGRDKDGFKFMDHFPNEIIAPNGRNETDLKIKLRNGSIFQLIGSDNIDSVMSTNPLGCVFAEYSLQDPSGWDYMRPILEENGGWAVFDYTPRGKNHGYTLYELAQKLQAEGDPRWFCQRLTVEDTGVMSPADIDRLRREGMDEELIQQEFYCSFQGVMQGSVYGRQIDQAERDGRVCGVPWQPELAVDTWWDLGTRDATAIWFTQTAGREVHVIDYFEETGLGIDQCCKHLQGLPYVWGTHNGPHDLENRQFAAGGKSAREVALGLGYRFTVVGKHAPSDGVNAGRSFMQRCWFDRVKTARGVNALTSYHYSWDEKRKVFSDTPYHDWSSNGADAWRYLAMGHKTAAPKRERGDRARVRQAGSGAGLTWMGR